MIDAATVGLASLVVGNLLAWLRNKQVMDLKFETTRVYMDGRFNVIDEKLSGFDDRLQNLEKA